MKLTKNIRLLFTILLLPLVGSAQWINEIHYDNSGGDVNEGIEIAGPAGTDLSCYQLIPYNGSNGAAYSVTALSGTISDEGCGYGAIWFPITGLQNGAPDGIALYNTCTATLIQFLSYEGSFTATSGNASGATSTNIGVTESGSTPTTSSLQLTGSGSSYADFTWSGPSASSHDMLNSGQSITPCGSANTITTGAISGAPFSVDCSVPSTASGSVAFTSSGTFNAGNVYTVQLSDASGSFASPTDIGTLSSTANSGSISFTIPATVASGSGYVIRIISDNPATTGSTSSSFTITQLGSCITQPAYITSVIINSCNPTCDEGYNELVFGNTGDHSVLVNSTNFDISYGTSLPAASLTDNLTTNPTTTAALNTIAGCPGTFVDGTGATLPPNASFVLAHDGLCTDALDWSGLCGAGPIYIIYTNDTDWSTSGTFKNGNTGGLRYFNSTITSTLGNVDNIDYNYNSTLLQTTAAGGDGDFVTFSSAGGAAASYGDDDCVLNTILLPVEIGYFAGEDTDHGNLLTWTTISERNSSHFDVERTADGQHWEYVGSVASAENSESVLHYGLVDTDYEATVNYYRLLQTDLDGTTAIHSIIVAIDNRFDQSTHVVKIINLLGQEINGNEPGVQIHIFEDGSSKKIFKR